LKSRCAHPDVLALQQPLKSGQYAANAVIDYPGSRQGYPAIGQILNDVLSAYDLP